MERRLLTQPGINIAAALRRGEQPTLSVLDRLIERGFSVKIDPRVPSRSFYVPEGTTMHKGRVVHPLFLWYRTPPQRLTSSILVSEIPFPYHFWVSYQGEGVSYDRGHFSLSGHPMNSDARAILKILNLSTQLLSYPKRK